MKRNIQQHPTLHLPPENSTVMLLTGNRSICSRFTVCPNSTKYLFTVESFTAKRRLLQRHGRGCKDMSLNVNSDVSSMSRLALGWMPGRCIPIRPAPAGKAARASSAQNVQAVCSRAHKKCTRNLRDNNILCHQQCAPLVGCLPKEKGVMELMCSEQVRHHIVSTRPHVPLFTLEWVPTYRT